MPATKSSFCAGSSASRGSAHGIASTQVFPNGSRFPARPNPGSISSAEISESTNADNIVHLPDRARLLVRRDRFLLVLHHANRLRELAARGGRRRDPCVVSAVLHAR